MLTSHATLRRDERLSQSEKDMLAPRLDAALATVGPRDEIAFITEDLGRHYAADGSNGDRLVIVVRGNQIITMLWRRNSQPMTADKFRVRSTRPLPTL